MPKSMWMCKKWQVDLRLVQKAPHKSWRLLAKLETRIRKENIKYHFCSILIPKQREIIIVFFFLTERLRRSAIPYMQRLLNDNERKKRDICKQISDYKPVNNGFLL